MQVLKESQKQSTDPASPPSLTTSVQPAKDWSERATPRAQTRNEVDPFEKKLHGNGLEGEILVASA